MQTEIEAKFLAINHDEMRKKLRALGAVCEQPNRLMRRKTFDFHGLRLRNEQNGWARVRDEGDKITMSYKQLDDRSFQGTQEVNLVIDDFDHGCEFLQALGLEVQNYQETKRESWKLGDIEIELDEWPWATPYIEIEGPSEAVVKELAEKLELDWSKVLHGSVEVVYTAEYNVTEEEVRSWPEILFTDVPDWLEKTRKKN